MKKKGNYLLTAVPLFVGLGIQMTCSMMAGRLYPAFYVMTAEPGMDILAGYNSIIIYVLILSQIIEFVVFGVWYKQQNRGKEVRTLTQIVHRKTIGGIIFLGIGLQLLTNLFLQAVYLFLPDLLEEYVRLVETAGIGQVNIASMLATVILAPIVEEIMFRGITMRIAQKAGAGYIAANLIQAAAFGIYHLNLLQGTYAAVLGFVLGYAAYRYGSIYPSILLHLAYNFSATLLNVAGTLLPGTVAAWIIIMVVTVVTMLLGMWFFRTDEKRESLN